MAEHGVFFNPFLSVGGTDLSAYVRAITPDFAVEANDDTASGDTTRSEAAGLLTWSFAVEFNQDFAAAKVDATLYAALIAKAVVAIIFRPDQGVVATANPQWAGNALVRSYSPGGGPVGGQLAATAVFGNAGTLARTIT
jgi:hypothetical protein